MKVVGLRRFGGPEVLEVIDLPTPHAGHGEVRIRVQAAAVNPVDTLIRSGTSAVRLNGSRPAIPGLDVAGVVDEVGPGLTTELAVGDQVLAMVNPTRPDGGGYAEFVVLPETWVVRAPAGASAAEAATLPANGLTALHALNLLNLPPGRVLAVTGAAGAVGGYAVQLGKAFGLRVYADAAHKDRDLVTSLGADVVVERGDQVADGFRAVAPNGVDAAVDAAVLGASLLPAIRDGGAVAYVRGHRDQTEYERRAASRRITLMPAYVHEYDGQRAKLNQLRQLVDDGRLSLRVADRFPAVEAAEAHRLLEKGGVRGRLIIEFP
ncbi:NADP-dependent oxidoreductase [Asanoa sp. NPDC049518]|uniref:NADP-dependent oxidoreductase n=1 Tax=unclassified Asanoa TaxID=2685164 RepID=UPI003448D49D